MEEQPSTTELDNLTTSFGRPNGTLAPAGNSMPPRLEWNHVCQIILAIVASLGNGLVIYVISTSVRMRSRHSPYWFILSLSVADFFIGSFNAPVELSCYMMKCSLYTFIITEYFRYIFLASSVANLCILTFDGYLAVVHPFCYASFMTAQHSILLVVGAWCTVGIVALPIPLGRLQVTSTSFKTVYEIFFVAVCIPLPMFFMIYAYIRISVIRRRHRQQIQAQEIPQIASNLDMGLQAASRSSERRKATLLATIAVVVCVFLLCSAVDLCWLTCKIAFACRSAHPLFKLTHVLRNLNAAANFFAYSIMKGDFQTELRSLFNCIL